MKTKEQYKLEYDVLVDRLKQRGVVDVKFVFEAARKPRPLAPGCEQRAQRQTGVTKAVDK